MVREGARVVWGAFNRQKLISIEFFLSVFLLCLSAIKEIALPTLSGRGRIVENNNTSDNRFLLSLRYRNVFFKNIFYANIAFKTTGL